LDELLISRGKYWTKRCPDFPTFPRGFQIPPHFILPPVSQKRMVGFGLIGVRGSVMANVGVTMKYPCLTVTCDQSDENNNNTNRQADRQTNKQRIKKKGTGNNRRKITQASNQTNKGTNEHTTNKENLDCETYIKAMEFSFDSFVKNSSN